MEFTEDELDLKIGSSDSDSGTNMITEPTTTTASMKEANLNKYLGPVQEVIQSEAVKRAWAQLAQNLELFNIKDPLAYEMLGKAYEETRDFVKLPEDDIAEFEAGNWEPIPLEDEEIFKMEPVEKLLGRFSMYSKALFFMIDHFETLRPIFSEIKQAYTEVFEKCEKEAKILERLRLEQIRLQEDYADFIRRQDREGDRQLTEIRQQTQALQDHLQWQQQILKTSLGVLSRMRYSLKLQNLEVKEAGNVYRNKVELLAREVVNQQGAASYEMTLPGKYTEMMAKFQGIQDPRELRRILNSARNQLSKALKKISKYEAEFSEF